jgi:amino acid adenylation domain-containing protein
VPERVTLDGAARPDAAAAQARLEAEQRILARGGGTRISRLGADERPPLSFAQERMFLLEQMRPGVSAYNVPRCLRVPGRLDPNALQRALDLVTSRHEVLRTAIVLTNGVPAQHVRSDARIVLEVHDLRSSPAEVDELVSRLAWQSFDLAEDVMVRAALLQLDDHDLLVFASHHLASDHASGRILLGELAEGYAAALEGREPSLPELPIQYGDFSAWQRKRFDGPLLGELVDYWRGQLAGAPDRFDLPADRPRPPAKTYRGAEARFSLPSELVDSLRALARSHNASFFTVLLSAFYTLLHRYTDMEDIVIGAPISGRHHDETQPLIGYFSNTLALRVAVEDELTFVELLERVRAMTLDAFAHQELPFERLVESLNPQRDPSHTPVFQVLLSHDVAPEPLMLGGMTLEPMPLSEWPWSRFDLSLGTQERLDGALDGVVEYSTDLFEPETIGRLIEHLTTLLEGIAAEPRRQIGKLPILPEGERRIVLEQWNDTERPVEGGCLHELVAAHAARAPERIAVEGSGTTLSYGELDERANRLAHHLQHLGVGAGDLVGICLDRVPATMVAILATLKTGAAYVPVEPTYPAERQAFMLDDAQAPVLVTQESLLEALPPHNGAVVCIDRDWTEIAARPATAPPATVDRDSLAYVIYTSGSTGRPKGVEIRHSSVVNLLASMRERPGLTEDDVVVNVTTPAFDLSVPDLYLPLVCGAKLVIASRETAQDPARLAGLLEDTGATLMQATPTTWRMLVEAGWEGRRELKIVCGGEALPRSLANELVGRGASLWHMYGPTETTVWSSVLPLQRGDGPPPIGTPIANTRFYVVDRHLQPVPIGIGGELLIGGSGLARGYRGRDELTAEKFLPDPFSSQPGARVYRTGDRMRLHPDGTLEFVGRIDHQVKLHGYRIELGEIEAALDAHPGVRQSVAIVHDDDAGGKRLVAYVVTENESDAAPDLLRRHLSASVPVYMLPSTFIRLDALPLTANGKLNTAALPRPDAEHSGLRAAYVAPSAPAEEVLAEIWATLLGVDRVGVNDDFFDLGGHSLLAVKMLARLHDAFGIELFLTTVFERPTLAALAEAVSSRVVADAGDDDLTLLLAELEAEEQS